MFDKMLVYFLFYAIILVLFGVRLMEIDLIKIKDKYGEKMMHLCRQLFPTLLEEEGKLYEILSSHFAYSKYLYDDIVNNSLVYQFKNYIYSLGLDKDSKVDYSSNSEIEVKSPKELLKMVGYTLYECKSEEEIQEFKKYYSDGEKLCTFKGGRLDSCYVFFAVLDNALEIKREDFDCPMRQDVYGTSVISIQFTKGSVNSLSIKNRYNHRVVNPDATYSNNLENIIPGLTKSFEVYYHLNISQNDKILFELPGYVLANDGKYYKYNYEIDNVYYCVDNIIVDNFMNFMVIDKYREKEKYLIIDYFIIDLVNKEVFTYDNIFSYHNYRDSFVDRFKNIWKIDIKRDRGTNNKEIRFIFNNLGEVVIVVDKYNRMISYKDNSLLDVSSGFLGNNKYLREIELPRVLRIGNDVLYENSSLLKINLPKVLEIGNYFMCNNNTIFELELPDLMKIGDNFLYHNRVVNKIEASNLEMVGDNFLVNNKNLEELELPNLVCVLDNFLYENEIISKINLPKLISVGKGFLCGNIRLEKLELPSLKEVESCFLYRNKILERIDCDNLEVVGSRFMLANRSMLKISLPSLIKVGNDFMVNNNSLYEIDVPNLRYVGKNFLLRNMILDKKNIVLLGTDTEYEIDVPNKKDIVFLETDSEDVKKKQLKW